MSCLIALSAMSGVARVVVVDSISGYPLPRASVFDRNNNPVGVTDNKGSLPYISAKKFPITISYIGYGDKRVDELLSDTIYMQEEFFELPEFTLEKKNRSILHMLGYVREYSSLTTYTDTVFLFREKMVDFMVSRDNKRIKGWTVPRVLSSRSYYQFANNEKLDSVSDESNLHFSWSDWVGLPPDMNLDLNRLARKQFTDTIWGRYSAAEIWNKDGDRVTVQANLLADTISRRWIPSLWPFFNRSADLERFVDFDRINATFEFNNVTDGTLTPENLDYFDFEIESAGRGHGMFRFNRYNQQFFVSTRAEVFILDKEYITAKEASKWEKYKFNREEVEIFQPAEIPDVSEDIRMLMERVDNLDKGQVRLELAPDQKLVGADISRKNFTLGRRALLLLKQLTGISAYKSRKRLKNQWRKFRNDWKNRDRKEEPPNSGNILIE